MDELEFRRRVYADPDTTDVAVLEAAKEDATKLSFLNDMRMMNSQLRQAMDVPVPEDLANKLIWQQSMTEHVREKQRTRWYVAMAATVAFVFGLSFTLTQQNQVISLGNEALAHMHHASDELGFSTTPLTLAQVNQRLEEYGAHLASDIGPIEVANYCHLDKIRSLHMILNSDNGPVSVFVVPHSDDATVPSSFGNDTYEGQGYQFKHANMMVVGDKNTDISAFKEKLRKSIQFSA